MKNNPEMQHQQQQLVIGGTGYSVVHPHINALPMGYILCCDLMV